MSAHGDVVKMRCHMDQTFWNGIRYETWTH